MCVVSNAPLPLGESLKQEAIPLAIYMNVKERHTRREGKRDAVQGEEIQNAEACRAKERLRERLRDEKRDEKRECVRAL